MPAQAMGYPNIIASAAAYYDTIDITANTNIRDVSELLDLWVHKQTPLLNIVNWAEGSGGLKYEWIYEHLGYGYVKSSAEVTGDGILIVETSDIGSTAEALKTIQQGALLMAWSSQQATHALYFVATITNDTAEMTAVITGTVDAAEKFFIIGNWVNEGSEPRSDVSRARTLVENDMAILRKDIQITGSMAATDMHAVQNELRHQTALRLKEMQKEREMALFFSMASSTSANTRTAAEVGLFRGLYSFLNGAPTGCLDSTTTDLSESSFNTLTRTLFDYQCMPTDVFGSAAQIEKFTEWDIGRVRTTVMAHLGGHHVTRYLTKQGFEVNLWPIPQFPSKFLFVVDSSQITLVPKKGRKLILEKLGKTGDYDRYQLLSEFTVCAKGHAIGTLGGGMDKLT